MVDECESVCVVPTSKVQTFGLDSVSVACDGFHDDGEHGVTLRPDEGEPYRISWARSRGKKIEA